MITVLSGGTGTPKLLQGIKEVVDPEDLTIIVNTLENDYFSGVYVAADIDTVLYTMTDMINEDFYPFFIHAIISLFSRYLHEFFVVIVHDSVCA